MGGVLGMIAPPINIPAMIIGAGIDLLYAGFGAPLALASFPLALALVYALGWPVLGRRPPLAKSPRGPAFRSGGRSRRPWSRPSSWPRRGCGRGSPRPGPPADFVIAAGVCVLLSPRFPVWRALLRATEEAVPVLGILAGVGAFIQVMTVIGARGWLVALLFGAPPWAIVAAAALGIPLFGAVSAFGRHRFSAFRSCSRCWDGTRW